LAGKVVELGVTLSSVGAPADASCSPA